jgi:tetratricopeptide (TPR) repeat protein
VMLYDTQTGNLQAAETATVDRPEQIFAEIDRLSFRLTNRLDLVPAAQEDQASIGTTMTANLEAYRDYSLAVSAAQSLHNKEALELLEKAIALDPQFAMAHARIGYIYAVTWGYSDKAKPYLEKAFSLSDRLTEKDRLNIACWYAVAHLDYANAIDSYRQLISKYPMETESYLRLGNLLRGEEEKEQAEYVLKQGLSIDGEDPLLYNALGGLYSEWGRHGDAIEMHRRYVALAPDEANAHDSLGMSYQWAGDYPAALQEYDRALELSPTFDIAVVHLANTRAQTGKYRDAIDLYKRYIAAATSELERARGYSGIAALYRRLKDLPRARAAAARAMQEQRVNVSEMYLVTLESGDKGNAAALEQRLLNGSGMSNRGRRPHPRYYLYMQGKAAMANGDPARALEYFVEAVHHAPATYELEAQEDCLANALLQLGKYDEAIAEYQRILQLNPNYPLARFHLAEALKAKGDIAAALANYQTFLQIWHDADENIPEVIAAKQALQTPSA